MERKKGFSQVKPEFRRAPPASRALPKKADSLVGGETEKSPPKKVDTDKVNGKKRKRDAKEKGMILKPAWDNLCFAISKGEPCSKGDGECKFSHDVKAYLEAKPDPGLAEKCPVFEKHEMCPSGLRCLFGKEHIRQKDDGSFEIIENREKKSPAFDSRYNEMGETNFLKRELQLALRKKKKKKFMQSNTQTLPPEGLADAEKKALDFRHKVYIAPLTTVGNLPFRRIMKDFGADITCGEMALAKPTLDGNNSEWALYRRHKCEDIFGVQIAGAHADQLASAAKILTEEINVDFIDLNLGCPIELITDKGAGSALMQRAAKLRQIIDGMTSATRGRIPIGIKMRAGWSSDFNAHSLISEIQLWRHRMEFGNSLCYVSIHGRSRQARYTSTANWDYIHRCSTRPIAAEALFRKRNPGKPFLDPIPVFGNGDILSYVEWEERLNRIENWKQELETLEAESAVENSRLSRLLTCDGKAYGSAVALKFEDLDALTARLTTCMVARGALIKPWISTELKEKRHWDISGSERFEIMRNFVNYGLEHWGSDYIGVNTTRRFLLEWLSFTCRYVPVGILDDLYIPQHVNDRPPLFYARDDRETLLGSRNAADWIKLSEMLLGPTPPGFQFEPKHKSNSYTVTEEEAIVLSAASSNS